MIIFQKDVQASVKVYVLMWKKEERASRVKEGISMDRDGTKESRQV